MGSADKGGTVSEYARIALAGIRMVNGAAALFAPKFMARRLGVDPDANTTSLYVLRLFGVRTVLIGAELLLPEGEERARAVRVAPLIHASDTAAATIALTRRHLPVKSAVTAVLISAVNTVLALLAQAEVEEPRGRRRKKR